MTEEQTKMLMLGEDSKAEPVDDRVYQDFIARFQAQVRDDLDKYRELRRLSEEEAKQRFVR